MLNNFTFSRLPVSVVTAGIGNRSEQIIKTYKPHEHRCKKQYIQETCNLFKLNLSLIWKG